MNPPQSPALENGHDSFSAARKLYADYLPIAQKVYDDSIPVARKIYHGSLPIARKVYHGSLSVGRRVCVVVSQKCTTTEKNDQDGELSEGRKEYGYHSYNAEGGHWRNRRLSGPAFIVKCLVVLGLFAVWQMMSFNTSYTKPYTKKLREHDKDVNWQEDLKRAKLLAKKSKERARRDQAKKPTKDPPPSPVVDKGTDEETAAEPNDATTNDGNEKEDGIEIDPKLETGNLAKLSSTDAGNVVLGLPVAGESDPNQVVTKTDEKETGGASGDGDEDGDDDGGNANGDEDSDNENGDQAGDGSAAVDKTSGDSDEDGDNETGDPAGDDGEKAPEAGDKTSGDGDEDGGDDGEEDETKGDDDSENPDEATHEKSGAHQEAGDDGETEVGGEASDDTKASEAGDENSGDGDDDGEEDETKGDDDSVKSDEATDEKSGANQEAGDEDETEGGGEASGDTKASEAGDENSGDGDEDGDEGDNSVKSDEATDEKSGDNEEAGDEGETEAGGEASGDGDTASEAGDENSGDGDDDGEEDENEEAGDDSGKSGATKEVADEGVTEAGGEASGDGNTASEAGDENSGDGDDDGEEDENEEAGDDSGKSGATKEVADEGVTEAGGEASDEGDKGDEGDKASEAGDENSGDGEEDGAEEDAKVNDETVESSKSDAIVVTKKTASSTTKKNLTGVKTNSGIVSSSTTDVANSGDDASKEATSSTTASKATVTEDQIETNTAATESKKTVSKKGSQSFIQERAEKLATKRAEKVTQTEETDTAALKEQQIALWEATKEEFERTQPWKNESLFTAVDPGQYKKLVKKAHLSLASVKKDVYTDCEIYFLPALKKEGAGSVWKNGKPSVKFKCLGSENPFFQDDLCHTVNMCRVVLDEEAWIKEDSQSSSKASNEKESSTKKSTMLAMVDSLAYLTEDGNFQSILNKASYAYRSNRPFYLWIGNLDQTELNRRNDGMLESTLGFKCATKDEGNSMHYYKPIAFLVLFKILSSSPSGSDSIFYVDTDTEFTQKAFELIDDGTPNTSENPLGSMGPELYLEISPQASLVGAQNVKGKMFLNSGLLALRNTKWAKDMSALWWYTRCGAKDQLALWLVLFASFSVSTAGTPSGTEGPKQYAYPGQIFFEYGAANNKHFMHFRKYGPGIQRAWEAVIAGLPEGTKPDEYKYPIPTDTKKYNGGTHPRVLNAPWELPHVLILPQAPIPFNRTMDGSDSTVQVDIPRFKSEDGNSFLVHSKQSQSCSDGRCWPYA